MPDTTLYHKIVNTIAAMKTNYQLISYTNFQRLHTLFLYKQPYLLTAIPYLKNYQALNKLCSNRIKNPFGAVL